MSHELGSPPASASQSPHAALRAAAPLTPAPPAPLPRRLRATRRPRAGAALRSLLTVMCGGIALLTAAVVLDPAALQARSISQPPATTRHASGPAPHLQPAAPSLRPVHPASQPAPAASDTIRLSPVQAPLTSPHDLSDSRHGPIGGLPPRGIP